MAPELLERDRAHSIVGAFYEVYNYYGYGLAERVYSNALQFELESRGHKVDSELAVAIQYKGHHVAWHRLDLVVDNTIIVETKAGPELPAYS